MQSGLHAHHIPVCVCVCLSVRSVCLLLQVALPCSVFADASSQLTLKGGTNAEMAPQIDYTVKVLLHYTGNTRVLLSNRACSLESGNVSFIE